MEEDFETTAETTENEDLSDIEIMRMRPKKHDDIIAVQSFAVILLAIGFFVANMFYPEICGGLFEMFEKFVKTPVKIPYIS